MVALHASPVATAWSFGWSRCARVDNVGSGAMLLGAIPQVKPVHSVDDVQGLREVALFRGRNSLFRDLVHRFGDRPRNDRERGRGRQTLQQHLRDGCGAYGIVGVLAL